MLTRTRTTILSVGFVLSAVGTAAFTSGCAQPSVGCSTALGYFAAEYTLIEGDPASACGQVPGDVLGMQTYYQEGGPNGTPDYTNANLAIRPESIGLMIEYAESRGAIDGEAIFHDANSIGSFLDDFPDDETFCRASDFADASVSLPAIDEVPDDPATEEDDTLPAQPAIEVTYKWSDARFVVSADAQGTQFEADLEYTQDGCTATYHVTGVYPAIGCETDDECNDDKNGINPDFAVRCNTDIGLCVLDAELPAYE